MFGLAQPTTPEYATFANTVMVRYLDYNDTGNGLTLASANLLSNIAVWAPVPLAVLFWVVLFAAGRVSL